MGTGHPSLWAAVVSNQPGGEVFTWVPQGGCHSGWKVAVPVWRTCPTSESWGTCTWFPERMLRANLNWMMWTIHMEKIMQHSLSLPLSLSACREPKISDLVRRRVLPMQVQSRWGCSTWTLPWRWMNVPFLPPSQLGFGRRRSGVP